MKITNLFSNDTWKALKFFETLSDLERSIVFYAENKASMNHFRGLINELTEKRSLQICYVTSVKDDPMLTSKNQKIKSFYIGDGNARTKFFLELKAKVLLMDMPDLNSFHIKRSKVYPVHYIYIFHSMFSIHSYLRKGAVDNYDTIFCVGKHHIAEIRESEKIYELKEKNLIKYGFGRLDDLLKEKEKVISSSNTNLVLITPSYGDGNLLEKCGIELIDILLHSNLRVILRPHFRILKDSAKLIESIQNKFGDNPNFQLEKGVIPHESFHGSLCMISDWSGISFEYAFTSERPVIFIDVPKKNLNPNSSDISLEPIEVSLRSQLGHVISPENISIIPNLIKDINQSKTSVDIRKIRSEIVFNISNSAKIGADFIQEFIAS